MRLRIAVVFAIGIGLIGFAGWGVAAPKDPFAGVSLFTGDIGLAGAGILILLAFVCGLLSYLVCYPYGQQLAALAVPAGLGVLAIRGGDMTGLILQNYPVFKRQLLFGELKWEGFFWLIVIGFGFLGIFLGQMILKRKTKPDFGEVLDPKADFETQKAKVRLNKGLNALVAVVGSVLIGRFFLGVFVRGISVFDYQLGGAITVQPAAGQIAFGVMVSFAAAAFLFKKFLNTSYVFVMAAIPIVTFFTASGYAKVGVLKYIAENWPVSFFTDSLAAILPIQMAAFGTLGAIAGFWLAVRYDYWRKHEMA